jgi:hypothetical protein
VRAQLRRRAQALMGFGALNTASAGRPLQAAEQVGGERAPAPILPCARVLLPALGQDYPGAEPIAR